MFEVGFSELFLLAVIALLVLGPERLPAVARTLGGLLRKARSSWYNLKRSIETEMAAADLKEPVRSVRTELERVSADLSRPFTATSGTEPATPAAAKTDDDSNAGGTPPPA